MAIRIPYGKHYSSPADLIALLQTRGLEIKDESKARHYLERIGYYRLSAYMYPLLKMPKEQHLYKAGATFSRIMMLYRFDKKLRMFIFNEIEKIEIAVRSAIVNVASDMIVDPFWITDANNFSDAARFNRTVSLIDRELHNSREEFIQHFKDTYSNSYPPAWILIFRSAN